MKRWWTLLLLVLSVTLLQQPNASRAAIIVASANEWHYEVIAGAGARELIVTATYPPVKELEMSVNTDAEPYLKDAEVDIGSGWRPMPQRDDSWFLPPACRTRAFKFRYRYLLTDAARTLDNIDTAKMHNNDTMLAPPSTWLLRPLAGLSGNKVVFHVTTPEGIAFVTGIFPVSGVKDTYEADAVNIPDMAYSGFGPFRKKIINLSGGVVEIAIAPGEFELSDSPIINWINTSARAVASYYGHFPIKRVLVLVRPSQGRGIGYGTTLGNGGAAISIVVGKSTRQNTFDKDWVMTHELVHCAFPSVERDPHAWVEEGLATYVEPWARMRVGALSQEQGWRDVVRDMPQGLPDYGDRGLDYTHTWERVYWGGALYFLIADVEIREKTRNRYGLDDALRGIAAAGGTVDVSWKLERTLKEGDRAVGVNVLTDLYQRMRAEPVNYDLDELWKKLGIEHRGDTIVFNDRAPLASVRKAISSGR